MRTYFFDAPLHCSFSNRYRFALFSVWCGGLAPLNRMSYYVTKSEAVGDPKALARTSGLMLLILVEVRGPIWITSFVTQDANQLQLCFNMLPYASTLSNLSEDSLVCLD